MQTACPHQRGTCHYVHLLLLLLLLLLLQEEL
jgi:hypothetical protein